MMMQVIEMEKIVEQTLLYDFYGELLTDHQKEIYEDAVFNDLSLSEIADQQGISRQGVHDLIKRCDKTLAGYEEKLGLARRFVEIQAGLDEITRCAQDISIYNDKFLGSAEVEKRTARICELASQLND